MLGPCPVLDFCKYPEMSCARLFHGPPQFFQILRIPHKGLHDAGYPAGYGIPEILPVLGSHSRKSQPRKDLSRALLRRPRVRNGQALSADKVSSPENLCPALARHLKQDLPVIQKESQPRPKRRQHLRRDGDRILSETILRPAKTNLRTFPQHKLPGKSSDSQLRSLHIHQEVRCPDARRLCGSVILVQDAAAFAKRHMGEIQADSGHPRPKHIRENFPAAAGRSQCSVDFHCISFICPARGACMGSFSRHGQCFLQGFCPALGLCPA